MTSVATSRTPAAAQDPNADAAELWHNALDRYLRLAREGASNAVLRGAIAAVHSAALERGRRTIPTGAGH